MEWSDIPWQMNVILAALLVVGVWLILRAGKTGESGKSGQLVRHFKEIGVTTFSVEEDIEEKKIGLDRNTGQKSEGIIRIAGRNIDFVNIISVSGQFGVDYFIDYLVRSPGRMGKADRKRTRLEQKRSSLIGGKLVGVEWKGDLYLSEVLNLDYQLKDRLLRAELDELKEDISIFPEPRHEYARIRTKYILPSSDLFEAMDRIARHVRLEW